MQKKKFLPEFPGKYSVNSGCPVIPNVRKTKNSVSGTFFTPETIIKGVKMQKFKFAEFSRKTVFRDFPVNYKEIPGSEGAMHNFRKFRIFWDVPEPNRMENDRMHSGTDGRTDGWTFCNY